MPRIWNIRHKDAPQGAIYIGRPSKWGNPFEIGPDGSREAVIRKFADLVDKDPEFKLQIQQELHGKDLVCFCWPNRCHGEVLLRIANDFGVNKVQLDLEFL